MRMILPALAAALLMGVATPAAKADSSISTVENARAMERSGMYVNRMDRDTLRRYGRTSSYWRDGYGYGDDYGYSYGRRHYRRPGVTVYFGPGYDPYDD